MVDMPESANNEQEKSEEQRRQDQEEAEAMWQDHLKERRESARKALSEVVKEKDIVSGSRPYLVVALKGNPPQSDYLVPYYNENVDFMNVPDFPKGAYLARYGVGGFGKVNDISNSSVSGGDIASAEFEGVTIGSRMGTVNIVDPIGVWPEIIANVSKFGNGMGRGAPNVEVIYGWTGLRGQKDNIQKIWGILTETNFEMDDNGLMRLSIKFVESSMETIKGMKFLEFKDMFQTDPSTKGVEGEEKTVNEMIDYFVENTSIGPQLAKNRIRLVFGKCADDEKTDRLMLEDYSVRYGDSFYAKMNSFIAKAQPPKDKRDKEYLDWAYKVVRKRQEKLTQNREHTYGRGRSEFSAYPGEVVTHIYFDWEPTPRPGEDEDVSFEYTNNAEFIGYINWRPDNEGDDKLYDWSQGTAYNTNIDKSRSKTLLSFNLDLSSLKALHGRIGAQLDSILTNYDEKDWEHIAEAIETHVGEINAGTPAEDMTFSEGDIMRRDNGAWYKGTFFKRILNEEADMEAMDDYEERQKSLVEIKEAVEGMNASKGGDSPAAKQLRALINRNVFRATASILGDPTLGSKIEPMSAYFVSNFMTPSYFSKYFSGKGWLFQKATHKFGEDGTYHTDLELLGEPGLMIPKSSTAAMAARWKAIEEHYQNQEGIE